MSPLRYLLACVVFAVIPAGCDGAVAVDPIGAPAADPSEPTTSTAGGGQGSQPVVPQPVAPYTASVATTDVSILYPLPLAGGAMTLLRPTDAGLQGELLSRKTFDTVVAS